MIAGEIGSKKTDDDVRNIIGDVLLAYSGTAVINCSLRQWKISSEDKRQLSEKNLLVWKSRLNPKRFKDNYMVN